MCNSLLYRFSAAQFVLWDLHLYLDTHPADLQTLALYKKYQTKYQMLKNEYEENYGPLSPFDGQGVEWFKNPWPWDVKECCN